MAVYYKLSDIDMIAKQEGGQPYLFDRGAGGWVADTQNVLADRLIGLDGESIGACVQINQEEAQQAIGRVEDGAQQ